MTNQPPDSDLYKDRVMAIDEIFEILGNTFMTIGEVCTQVTQLFKPLIADLAIRYAIEHLGITEVDIKRVEFIHHEPYVRLHNHRLIYALPKHLDECEDS